MHERWIVLRIGFDVAGGALCEVSSLVNFCKISLRGIFCEPGGEERSSARQESSYLSMYVQKSADERVFITEASHSPSHTSAEKRIFRTTSHTMATMRLLTIVVITYSSLVTLFPHGSDSAPAADRNRPFTTLVAVHTVVEVGHETPV